MSGYTMVPICAACGEVIEIQCQRCMQRRHDEVCEQHAEARCRAELERACHRQFPLFAALEDHLGTEIDVSDAFRLSVKLLPGLDRISASGDTLESATEALRAAIQKELQGLAEDLKFSDLMASYEPPRGETGGTP